MTEKEQKTLDELIRDLEVDIRALTKETEKADQALWDKSAIVAASEKLATDIKESAASLIEFNKLKSEHIRYVHDIGKAVDAAKKKLPEPPIDRKRAGREDALRIAVLGVFAAIGVVSLFNGMPWLGLLAVGLSDVYLLAILYAASIRSDDSYRYRGWSYDWSYEILPSKLWATVFVVFLFAAIWLGFAGLYTGVENRETGTDSRTEISVSAQDPATERRYAPYTTSDALRTSFLTLATFDGPPQGAGDGARSLIVSELANAVLLIIGIFAMLINRISDF